MNIRRSFQFSDLHSHTSLFDTRRKSSNWRPEPRKQIAPQVISRPRRSHHLQEKLWNSQLTRVSKIQTYWRRRMPAKTRTNQMRIKIDQRCSTAKEKWYRRGTYMGEINPYPREGHPWYQTAKMQSPWISRHQQETITTMIMVSTRAWHPQPTSIWTWIRKITAWTCLTSYSRQRITTPEIGLSQLTNLNNLNSNRSSPKNRWRCPSWQDEPSQSISLLTCPRSQRTGSQPRI